MLKITKSLKTIACCGVFMARSQQQYFGSSGNRQNNMRFLYFNICVGKTCAFQSDLYDTLKCFKIYLIICLVTEIDSKISKMKSSWKCLLPEQKLPFGIIGTQWGPALEAISTFPVFPQLRWWQQY